MIGYPGGMTIVSAVASARDLSLADGSVVYMIVASAT